MNPNSQYYLSFDLGYPNAYDRAHGRTGAQLMVHGDCSSRGCYSMTDEQISEIYALGRDSFFGGQKSFQVQAYPFRMTPQNFAKHRNNPHLAFWKMLKKGNDHFEVSQLEPKVNVCDKRYVFDAESPPDARYRSTRPANARPTKCRKRSPAAVRDKQRQDEHPDRRAHPPQYAARSDQDQRRRRHASGVRGSREEQPGRRRPAGSPFVSTPPGTIPVTVRPPRIPELAGAPTMDNLPPVQTAKPPASRACRMAIAEPETQAQAGRPLEQPLRQPVRVEVGQDGQFACREDRPKEATARPHGQHGGAGQVRARSGSRKRRPSRPASRRMARPQAQSEPSKTEAKTGEDRRREVRAKPAGTGRAGPGQPRDERRRAGGPDRQLRQPLVGLR